MNREQLLRELEIERVAPKPRPYRNPRRNYETEIEQHRDEQDPAELAVRRYEASLAMLDEEE